MYILYIQKYYWLNFLNGADTNTNTNTKVRLVFVQKY